MNANTNIDLVSNVEAEFMQFRIPMPRVTETQEDLDVLRKTGRKSIGMQPKVEVADDAALDFVVDLIHPDSSHKEKARAAAGAAFDRIGVDHGELFEFSMALASTLAADPEDVGSKIRRGNSTEDYARLTPTVLSAAGRVILDWPRGFESYLDGMRSRMAGSSGSWGPKSQFGPARFLKDDRHLAPAMRMEISRRIDGCLENPGWKRTRVIRADGELGSTDLDGVEDVASSFQVAKEFGIDQQLIARWIKKGFVSSVKGSLGSKSVTMVDRKEVATLVHDWNDAVPALRVRERLGVDALAVRELAAAGLVQRMDGVAAFSMKGGDAYSSASLDRLVDGVHSKTLPVDANVDGETLFSVATRIAGKRVSWAQVFGAILDGRVAVHARTVSSRAALVDALVIVSDRDLVAALASGPPPDIAVCRERLSVGEAAAYLGTTERAVARFIGGGLIATNGADKWKLDRAVVDEFRSGYMLAGEISRRYGIPCPSLGRRLAAKGVHAVNREARKNFVWPRDEVETALGVCADQSGLRYSQSGGRNVENGAEA
jgi:transposase-like protein